MSDAPAVLDASFLFGGLPDGERRAIAAVVRPVQFVAGATIVREGEPGDACYVVATGEAEAVTTNLVGAEVVLQRFGPGASFGAVALTNGGPRTASVRAATDLEAYALARDDFAALRATLPSFAARLDRYVDFLDIDRFLRRASPFARLPLQALRRMVPKLGTERFAPGETVVREGEPADRFYLVRAGRLEVLERGVKRAELGAGDCFGEVALLTGGPRVATVRAAEPSELLSLAKEDFDAVVAEHATLRARLNELARIRYRGAAVVALARPDPVTTFMPFLEAKRRGSYWSMLGVGTAVFAVCSVLAARSGSEAAVYGALVLGSFVVPVVYVTYLAESDILAARPFTLGATFVLGAALGLPLAGWLEATTGSEPGELVPALRVGLIEEFAKILGVGWLLRRTTARFQMDGVVFGAAAGMGFAAFETMQYGIERIEQVGALLTTLWLRSLLAPLAHGTWTAIVAATIWRGRSRPGERAVGRVAGAFAVAVVLHGLWDWQPLPGLLGLFGLVALGAVGIVILRAIVQDAVAEEAGAVLALNPELAEQRAGAVALSCARCGQEAPPGSRYCVRCGAALRRS